MLFFFAHTVMPIEIIKPKSQSGGTPMKYLKHKLCLIAHIIIMMCKLHFVPCLLLIISMHCISNSKFG